MELPVDFEPIDIILVGPFAGVRKYAQLTRTPFAKVRILFKNWQQMATRKMLPSVAKIKPGGYQVQ